MFDQVFLRQFRTVLSIEGKVCSSFKIQGVWLEHLSARMNEEYIHVILLIITIIIKLRIVAQSSKDYTTIKILNYMVKQELNNIDNYGKTLL